MARNFAAQGQSPALAWLFLRKRQPSYKSGCNCKWIKEDSAS
jgi:hypothetical protein